MSDKIDEIKNAIKQKKVIIGTNETLKNLKLGKLEKVFLSKNCPEKIANDIKHYAKLSKTEIVQLPIVNSEVGVVCKKPFSISVLSIKK